MRLPEFTGYRTTEAKRLMVEEPYRFDAVAGPETVRYRGCRAAG